MYSNSNLNGCSTYNFANDLLRYWVEKYPDVFVYWVLPKDWKVDTTREVTHPRIKKLYFDILQKQYYQTSVIPREWFDNFHDNLGKYCWDVMLTEALGAVPTMAASLYGYNDRKNGKGRIVVFHGFLMTKEIIGPFLSKSLEISQIAGMAEAVNVFPREELKEKADAMARRFFQPSVVKKILSNSHIVSSGVDFDFVDSLIGDALGVKNERFSLCFSGRANDGYDFDSVLRVYDYVFKSGCDVDIILTTPTVKMFKNQEEAKAHSYMKAHKGVGREEYLKIMSRCHAFIFCPPGVFEIPLTVLEMLWCGLIGVFKRDEGIRSLLPDWYPEELFYGSYAEAHAVVKNLQTNYDKYRALVPKIREFVRGYDVRSSADRMMKVLKDSVDGIGGEFMIQSCDKFVAGEDSRKLMDLCLPELPDEFTFEDFDRVFKEKSDMGTNIFNESKTGRGRGYFYRLLLEYCDDKCDAEFPVFVKKTAKKQEKK